MKPEAKHPHLGEIITRLLQQRGMSKAEFGRRLNTSRQNVSLILQKRTLDTDTLWRIGEILGKDFFALLSFRQTGSTAGLGTMQMRLEFANQRLILVTAEKDDVFHDDADEPDLPFRFESKEDEPEPAISQGTV